MTPGALLDAWDGLPEVMRRCNECRRWQEVACDDGFLCESCLAHTVSLVTRS